MSRRCHLSTFAVVVAVLLGTGVPAAAQVDVTLGATAASPGETATVAVVVSGGSGDISLITVTLEQPAALPAPTAVAGPDAATLEPQDVFVDDLGGSSYRLTAFARAAPDMASGGGHVVDLVYDLTGVEVGVYPLTVQAAALHTNANAEATVGFITDGAIEVGPPGFVIFVDGFETGTTTAWSGQVP